MPVLDIPAASPTANLVILVVCGGVVWLAGTRLSIYADAISRRTGLGRAFVGALLLGGATSLPEIATTLTAASIGNAPMAVNNLFGGIAMQVAVLAVIDLLLVEGALTFFSPRPVLLLGGVLLILQIALALAAVSAGEIFSIVQVGLWPVLLFVAYATSLWFMQRFEGRESWFPAERPPEPEKVTSKAVEAYLVGGGHSAVRLYGLLTLNAVLVLIGGWGVARIGDALAVQTGLGGSFVGATLIALTTSLPELSTTAGAVRLRAYTMAIANIFGTNTLEVALLLPADVFYREGTIIDAVGNSAVFVGALGIVVTGIYLWGLLERRNRTILRMGVDSALVLVVYLLGIGLLYGIE